MRKILILLIALIGLSVHAQRIKFNNAWKFKLKDQKGAEAVTYKDADWRVLNLPHDWSIEGEYKEDAPTDKYCGYLPSGIGWYRKTITVPKSWKGKHVEIAFDGVFMNSDVWANGRHLGKRPYGWISFAYDITPEVENTNSITFAVRVDNDKQPAARWYTGSGIYANTWIQIDNKVYIPHNGTIIRTKLNKVSINTEIDNTLGKNKKGKLLIDILDTKGKVVAHSTSNVKVSANGKVSIPTEIEVPNAQLWSVDTPNLYTAVSKLVIAKKQVDVNKTRFGIRDIKWVPETGFWLNGVNIKMQGVCDHQSAGALGAAVPDKILRFRIKQLKSMGVNTIRTSHNPQTPEFYAMCDSMGMMVLDEIFDGWKQKAANDYGGRFFKQWWKRDLTDWIIRDRNHPSVMFYSMGNETSGDVAKDMVAQCHLIDPTRLVTSGNSEMKYMDILGMNGASESVGGLKSIPKDRIFIATENTHTFQVRGYYRTKTWYRDGYPNKKRKPHWYPDLTKEEVFHNDWTDSIGRRNSKQIFNSSYDNAIVRLASRQNIAQLRDMPNFAGSFRWTGYDYIGEATYNGGWPFKTFVGGAIDMANFEKDLFYLYQSQWTKKPMIHVLPHWTHPTLKEGVEIPVWIYSNCEEVELFFNGKSLGKMKPGKKWDKMQCQYMVGYKPGELKAVGYNKGKIVATEYIHTAGVPSKISLSVDGEPLAKKGKDIVQVRVTTTDSKGEMYPYGENRTYFKVLGAGKVRALDNGSPMDVEKHYEATNRIAFYGLTRAYIESLGDGDVSLFAASILGEKRQVTSKQVSIDTELLTLRGKTPSAYVEIYYTTDGSTPTKQSKVYTKPFDVELGTTVKALVIINGEPMEIMHERFAKNVGFVLNSTTKLQKPIGDQAEEARFHLAKLEKTGSNFNGKGYLYFTHHKGSWVQWYHENDGDQGTFNVKLRYSASSKIRSTYKVQLKVNDKVQILELPAKGTYRKDWNTYKLNAHLQRGANTIRVTALDNDGLCVDELTVD